MAMLHPQQQRFPGSRTHTSSRPAVQRRAGVRARAEPTNGAVNLSDYRVVTFSAKRYVLDFLQQRVTGVFPKSKFVEVCYASALLSHFFYFVDPTTHITLCFDPQWATAAMAPSLTCTINALTLQPTAHDKASDSFACSLILTRQQPTWLRATTPSASS